MQINRLILDMDGVLWHGNTPIPNLPRFFDGLNELGMDYALATNNATRTGDMYVEKLLKFGVDVRPDRIVSSADATAMHLKRTLPAGSPLYVVGEEGLYRALREQGFEVFGTEGYEAGRPVHSVVVGFNRQFRYRHLAGASLYINEGANFVATNPDTTFPSEIGNMPGNGAAVAYVHAATGATPEVIGKPGPRIFEVALRTIGATDETLSDVAAETAMVGDRLNTDIIGAIEVGMQTVLVMGGITTPEALAASDVAPTHVMTDIHHLLDYLRANR